MPAYAKIVDDALLWARKEAKDGPVDTIVKIAIDRLAVAVGATGAALTYAELDARADIVAAALSPFLTGPDQVVAVAMAQDNWQIVAAHLGIPLELEMIDLLTAANGFLMFGWSTAFLLSVTGRLRMLEHDWLERPDKS